MHNRFQTKRNHITRPSLGYSNINIKHTNTYERIFIEWAGILPFVRSFANANFWNAIIRHSKYDDGLRNKCACSIYTYFTLNLHRIKHIAFRCTIIYWNLTHGRTRIQHWIHYLYIQRIEPISLIWLETWYVRVHIYVHTSCLWDRKSLCCQREQTRLFFLKVIISRAFVWHSVGSIKSKLCERRMKFNMKRVGLNRELLFLISQWKWTIQQWNKWIFVKHCFCFHFRDKS